MVRGKLINKNHVVLTFIYLFLEFHSHSKVATQAIKPSKEKVKSALKCAIKKSSGNGRKRDEKA